MVPPALAVLGVPVSEVFVSSLPKSKLLVLASLFGMRVKIWGLIPSFINF